MSSLWEGTTGTIRATTIMYFFCLTVTITFEGALGALCGLKRKCSTYTAHLPF